MIAMLRRLRLALTVLALTLVILLAFAPWVIIAIAKAQDPNASVADIVAGVSFACQHQTWIVYVLAFLSLHFGASGLSALLKKSGFTSGGLVGLIRLIAIDVKPPDAVIVADAAEIKAAAQQK